MKAKSKSKKTDNPREYKLLMREENLSCSRCPPHRVENAGRKPKHGEKKPKKKDKR